MKTLPLLLALEGALPAQLVGNSYGPVLPNQPGLLVFGEPTPGGTLTALTPDRGGVVFAVVGLRREALPLDFGQVLLVDPSVSTQALLFSSGVEFYYPLALPPAQAIVGLSVDFQCFHFFSGHYRGSRGVEVTIQ